MATLHREIGPGPSCGEGAFDRTPEGRSPSKHGRGLPVRAGPTSSPGGQLSLKTFPPKGEPQGRAPVRSRQVERAASHGASCPGGEGWDQVKCPRGDELTCPAPSQPHNELPSGFIFSSGKEWAVTFKQAIQPAAR